MNRLLLQLPAALSCRLYLVYLRYTSMSLVPGLGQQDIADIPEVTFPQRLELIFIILKVRWV